MLLYVLVKVCVGIYKYAFLQVNFHLGKEETYETFAKPFLTDVWYFLHQICKERWDWISDKKINKEQSLEMGLLV